MGRWVNKRAGLRFFVGRGDQDGLGAGRVEAQAAPAASGVVETIALGADRDTSAGSDFQRGAQAPDIGPPGAARGGAPDGTFLLFGEVPGALGDELEFALRLVGVARKAQGAT